MDAIIDLITPRKNQNKVKEEECIESEANEAEPVKKVRRNLVRAPKGYISQEKSSNQQRKDHRAKKKSSQALNRGRSKENKFSRANSGKSKMFPNQGRAASHGYLKSTASYSNKRYMKEDKYQRKSLVNRGLTKPTGMKLHTGERARRHSSKPALSQDQRDELFLKNLKPFKARNISARIMQSNGDLGLPRVKKRPTTEFKEFKFRTSLRASSRGQSLTRSTNSSTASSVSSQPRRSLSRPTKARLAQPRRVSNPSMFQRSYKRHVEAQNKQDLRKKAEHEAIIKMRQFKAQPLPDFSRVEKFKKPPAKKPTVPFTPKTLIKSRLSGELLKQRIHQKTIQQKEESNFHASNLPDTTYSPEQKHFGAKKPLTLAETPHFASDSRAIDRQIFDEKMKDIRRRQKKIQLLIQQRKEHQDKVDLKEYRRTLIHRPLPLPVSSVVVENPSHQS